MKILIVGQGGREHALLRKLHSDAPEAAFYITRGNGGTAELATHLSLAPTDAPALAAWAERERVDLTVVGPEAALVEGIVDVFQRRGLPIFGPTKDAARIEASKAFTKKLLDEAGVATARYATFTEYAAAHAYIREHGAPIVVKASGLAAGKGAVVCMTETEALDAARAMLEGAAFGGAGSEIVIEEFMEGEELSIFALCDGTNAVPLLAAQDHKRIGEGDTGPNTGGMGAYAPVSLATDVLIARIRDTILTPTLAAMREEELPFCGLLFAGIMVTADGPKVVEFNARFGDPETQVVLPLLSSSLLDPLLTVARGESIEGVKLEWRPAAAVTTVLAARGYPDNAQTGDVITIPPHLGLDSDLHIYHAGTKRDESGALVTSGGRVLAVTAIAASMQQAAESSRNAAAQIEFNGRQYRRDIGWRELERNAGAS